MSKATPADFQNASLSFQLANPNLYPHANPTKNTGTPTVLESNPRPRPLATSEAEKRVDEDNSIDYLRPMEMDIEKLHECYLRVGSVHRAGMEFNITGETVRKYLKAAKKPLNRTKWNESEIDVVRDAYSALGGFDALLLAKALGRTVAAIHCKADSIGICGDRGKQVRTPRSKENMSAAQKIVSSRPGVIEKRAAAVSAAWKKNGHPKGFLGHKRTPEELEKMKQGSLSARANPNHRINSPEYRQRISDRQSKAMAERPKENAYSRAKSGWITVGGQRLFARSRWEANYARYLEWMKSLGEIQSWEHEPHTFWFDKIKRGVRSYLPDFRVVLKSGAVEWHEVKGWMDAKSATKIKRMAKYHPKETLRVFSSSWFKDAARKLASIVPGWESPASKSASAKPRKARKSTR